MNQWFLLGTTVYVVIPSLMVFVALVMRSRASRIANITLGIVYALTIIAGAIGEWGYYILGSAIEVALLAAIVYYASIAKIDPSRHVITNFSVGLNAGSLPGGWGRAPTATSGSPTRARPGRSGGSASVLRPPRSSVDDFVRPTSQARTEPNPPSTR